MYRRERTPREGRYKHDKENQSFSSSLLDKIYRSIDEGDKHCEDLKFFTETIAKKQTKSGGKSNRVMKEEEGMAGLRRACLIEKWMDKKVGEKVGVQQRRQYYSEFDRKLDHHDNYSDHDVMFFSSTSSSSDSSSGGFSSSDTESMYCAKSKASCFAPPMPKPVRTSVTSRSEQTEKKQRTLLYEERRELHVYDDYHHNSVTTEQTPKLDQVLIKSKSRALKIYKNLKKVKQPISPGGRLASFINSLFTTGTTKKATKNSSSVASYDDASAEKKTKSVLASTCSSASSYSRSCLSKNSPSTREKLRNGVKRTVSFYPVSVIVDEDCRPCGHKCLYEEQDSTLMPVTVPTAWKIRRSPTRKTDEELKVQVFEKTRRVEEAARVFLRDYRQSQMKNELMHREFRGVDEEDDDDAASYSSSDLFELDHLSVIGNDRYREELPVYETTHVDTNRAIANGLIM
ncbi:hypothetical protein FNV43_RR11273 [Rhamnella rubrinervis]|uniref:Protein BIG GRAIN 1-like A n=1 Tax=Rhamnella rubrinervis TaxID=2594499 RepID=A0A8K0H5P2_9ROSA|nr:hypothetical protein FNV43_RR11273 [Rhamnella rubrinervis]